MNTLAIHLNFAAIKKTAAILFKANPRINKREWQCIVKISELISQTIFSHSSSGKCFLPTPAYVAACCPVFAMLVIKPPV